MFQGGVQIFTMYFGVTGFSGNGLGNDVPDSLPVNDVQRTKLAVTHLQQKILKIR